jgi:4-hydroxybenzoate polyprenyltransferase
MSVSGVARAASAAPRGVLARLRALRVIHPFPTLLNVLATGALAFLAVRGWPGASMLVRMLAVMLCAQSAIGAANDYYDRKLDAATKPWKPIPAGVISPGAAAALSIVLISATAVIAATLGAASLALAMLGLGCGLTYDAQLKRTRLSALPFMVAIPTLPAWVWVTLDAWQPVCWWLLPLGALIGLSLHLSNTLPDIPSDAAQGVRGLAHRLGELWAMRLAWASFAAALLLSAGLFSIVRTDLRWLIPTLAFGLSALAASIAAATLRRDGSGLQFGFGVLSMASVALAVGWLGAVT